MDYKVISDRMSLRDYRVRAYVNPTTGAVREIKAGCRTWRNFSQAIAHYVGEGTLLSPWQKQPGWKTLQCTVASQPDDRSNFTASLFRPRTAETRNDALLTLARLAAKCERYKNKVDK